MNQISYFKQFVNEDYDDGDDKQDDDDDNNDVNVDNDNDDNEMIMRLTIKLITIMRTVMR